MTRKVSRRLIFPLMFFILLSVATIFLAATSQAASASSQSCLVDDTQGRNIDYRTIQEAIDDANCLTIQIAPGTYVENLVIARSVTLVGAKTDLTVIDGGEQDRVVTVLTGTVNISGLTIRKGYTLGPDFVSKGGAGIYNVGILTGSDIIVENNQVFGEFSPGGGGIYNGREMTIRRSIIRNNYATQQGGGIDNEGTMTLVDSEISNNQSEGSAGADLGGGGIHTHRGSYTLLSGSSVISNFGISNRGGGIYNNGRLEIENTVIRGNSVNNLSAGGIFSQGELRIDHSTIVENVSHDNGGGIHATGPVTITYSVIANNVADRQGGGIYLYTDPGGISVWIYRNQIIGNQVNTSSTSGTGGGMYLSFGYGALSSVVVDGNFVQNNAAYFCGGATLEGRGILWSNNIVSGNQGSGVCTEGGSNEGESRLVNNTIMFNQGSGIEVSNPWDLVVHIANNILANNQQYGFAYRVFDGSFSGATFMHNALWENQVANLQTPMDLIGRNGNFSAPPFLVDPLNGNWHLTPASTLIDAGLNDLAPLYDFERNSRPLHNTVDIGADEYSEVDPLFEILLTLMVLQE